MNTGQNYGGKGDSATQPTPAAQNAAPSPQTPYDWRIPKVVFLDEITIRIESEFGRSLNDPILISNLRQDLRAWFLAYVPVSDASLSPNDLTRSIHCYDMLDDFFSTLIEEGIKRMEGKANV